MALQLSDTRLPTDLGLFYLSRNPALVAVIFLVTDDLVIETNISLDTANAQALVAQASQAVAGELGKPERYVMVTVQSGTPMLMAGTPEPTAFLDLRSIGLPDGGTEALSKALCQLIEAEIGVPQDRVYINFADVPRAHWGWNGGTF